MLLRARSPRRGQVTSSTSCRFIPARGLPHATGRADVQGRRKARHQDRMTTAYLQSAKRNEAQGLASGTRRILDTPWPAAGWTDDAGAKPLGAIRDPSLGKHNERHGKADHQDDSGTENEPPFMIRPNHK